MKTKNLSKIIFALLLCVALLLVPAQTFVTELSSAVFAEDVEETANEDNAEATDTAADEAGDENAEDGDSETAEEDAEETEPQTNEDGEVIRNYETTEGGWPVSPEIDAGAYYLLEPTTGSVLNNKNGDQQMYPASTTKILTCLIALQNCSLEETVTFSANAVALEAGDSNIGAVAGEEMTMRDCLFGLMVASGNECANAIAEHVAGSNEAFAEMMNEKARELGANNSHFTNPSGLYDSNHFTTPADLAVIAKEAYENSTFVNIISHRNYTIGPTNMDPNEKYLDSTVELIRPTSDSYSEYVIGGKTGYLLESGRCLVAFAKKDGVSLISVVMNAGYEAVFPETMKNFNYGFDNFAIKNVSELESRFSYMDDAAKVYLDPRSEIIAVSNVPFEALSTSITYVSDMEQDVREAAFEDLGMSPDSPLRLYAELKYSYDDHYLGKVYAIIDPSKEIAKASFIEVKYINVWYFLAGVVVILIIFLIAAKRPKRRRYR